MVKISQRRVKHAKVLPCVFLLSYTCARDNINNTRALCLIIKRPLNQFFKFIRIRAAKLANICFIHT